MYVVVWEFAVRPDAAARFEELYGPQGDWVALFRGHQGYLDTELLADIEAPGRYLTLDRWITQEAYESFRMVTRDEFDRLDAMGRELTLDERFLGSFRG